MSAPDRAIPAPGQAPLVAPNAAALLRRNADDPDIASRPAIRFGDRTWTHGEFFAESCRFARLFAERLPATGPRHVAVLLDNTPDYLFAFGGAALVGAAVVGLNHTRRGEHLLVDMQHTDCSLLLVEPRHLALVDDVRADLPPTLITRRFEPSELREPLASPEPPAAGAGERESPGCELSSALDALGDVSDPGGDPSVDDRWALIFTSGTSAAPKAVICTQRRLLVTGYRMALMLELGRDDCGYVCMPLFHSNAIQVGWAPSLVAGCAVGLARRFSASGWLPDVRRYGATYFNYTGKPLAYLNSTPEQADDADNPLRVAFGNEGSPEVVATFARRFAVDVIDAYGATEGGIAVNRRLGDPPGALGMPPVSVIVVGAGGAELPPAEFDPQGRLSNAIDCVGEIVNTAGIGPFEGYYGNAEATAATTRNGWYWSGDLGYKDRAGFLYFAGRNADWIRVDGENFPAAPIEEALRAAPGVVLAAVYGVPDAQAGDQVMAGLVLDSDAAGDPGGSGDPGGPREPNGPGNPGGFDGARFAAWLDALASIGPKWHPRYIRILRTPPTTGTNKIVKRALVHEKFRSDRCGGDPIFVRLRGESGYRPFGESDEDALRAEFTRNARERFWDL